MVDDNLPDSRLHGRTKSRRDDIARKYYPRKQREGPSPLREELLPLDVMLFLDALSL